jgi:hypothetical protein
MDYLPLTRPEPFTEIPAGIETLFPELPSPGARPVEVIVALPDNPCAMYVVVPESGALEVLREVLAACAKAEEFEIAIQRYTG